VTEQAVKPIRIQSLHIASWHRRTVWGNMTALRDLIADHGVIQPLVVRERKPSGYEIVCGVRRFKAAGMADLKTLPCIVVDLDDVDAIAMQVAENIEREGLHPIDEALYYEDLNGKGMDHAAIAKRFQVKKRDVVRRMKLLALGPAARRAFVAGKFDEDAALALARLSDPAKQADVLSAIDQGAIQPEEIQGFVQREFTASLDDVPWRMTDEKLLVPAGSCSTCHKRSDAQKDLFAVDQKGIRCLDTDCYRKKMDAVWTLELARPAVAVLDQTAQNLFITNGPGRPVVMNSSGMVDADAQCKHLVGHTWREAVFRAVGQDGEAPTVYLARDQDGRPRFLMREAVVGKMVRKSDAAAAARADAAFADPAKAAAPEATGRAESRIRRSVIQRMTARILAVEDMDTWGWVAERVVASAAARAIAHAATALADAITAAAATGAAGFGTDDRASLVELARRSNRQARRVATAVLIYDDADGIGELSQAIRDLAALCEIDLAALEREVRGA
jgi:ParB/RepB/Spo0J family partition protein